MKNTALLKKLLVLTVLSAGLAHAGDPHWITDSKGCKVANVFPQEDESISWTGACEQGLANGEGKLTWLINGIVTDTYEGQLVKGWAEGEGKLTRKDGVYTGEWKNSLQNGKGRYQHEDGTWYQGGWKDGKPHGHGQMLTPEGKIFSGTWYDGYYEDEQPAENRG